MKYALVFLVAICLASCTQPNVICTCYQAGRDSTWNLGQLNSRPGNAITAECDTIGARSGMDTCRWDAPN